MYMNTNQYDGIEIIRQFNNALNAADVDSMMALTTEDTVFENTFPAPDGERYSGQAQVRAFWVDFFRKSSSAKIESEDIFAMGDRYIMLWIYHWTNNDGTTGHVRGVDVYRIKDNLIAEKLSYVKG